MTEYCIEKPRKCEENEGAPREFAKAIFLDSKRGGFQSSAKGA